ncbi:hypothetical protein CEK62_14940 [Alcanivorax sp. N3-2A]|nr:hypothetical protein CEK62_14940 [Alcanivorax sp. N3-2A]|tara:strand:+ start:8229 stop:8786 length:558 start_codon:yes stop_codon:yes gene_type:complete
MLPDLLRELGVTLPLEPAHRPVVGVSACLLGRRVRYDGDHKYDPRVGETLAGLVRLREFCPEVAIGLPVPRPPIRVVDLDGRQRVRDVAAPGHDFTAALSGCADHLEETLDGFILKARSPSCGLGDTPVHDAAGVPHGVTDGAFAARLRERFAGLPMCSETGLVDPQVLAAFVTAVFRHWRARNQ